MALSELLAALRAGTVELRYWRHVHTPLSPWRQAIDAVVESTRREAGRYGIGNPKVDRRRAYQVARMSVADERGVHLQQRVPDAWLAYSPPSAATFHDGKRRYPAPAQRLQSFRTHPQALAYLLAPPSLARLGLGGSPPGGLGVIEAGEHLDAEQVVARLRTRAPGVAEGVLREWAGVLVALAVGTTSNAAGIPAEPASA